MSPVTILFHIRVQAEERDALARSIAETGHKSRADDDCLSYDCFLTDGSQTDLLVLQTWETLSAYEAHSRRTHVDRLFERYENVLLEPVCRTLLTPTRETAAL